MESGLRGCGDVMQLRGKSATNGGASPEWVRVLTMRGEPGGEGRQFKR